MGVRKIWLNRRYLTPPLHGRNQLLWSGFWWQACGRLRVLLLFQQQETWPPLVVAATTTTACIFFKVSHLPRFPPHLCLSGWGTDLYGRIEAQHCFTTSSQIKIEGVEMPETKEGYFSEKMISCGSIHGHFFILLLYSVFGMGWQSHVAPHLSPLSELAPIH